MIFILCSHWFFLSTILYSVLDYGIKIIKLQIKGPFDQFNLLRTPKSILIHIKGSPIHIKKVFKLLKIDYVQLYCSKTF